MSFPRYKHYKDSGVEWLGEVPEHWNVISIKWLSPVLRGASPRPIDDPKYFDDDGEYAWVRIADVTASDGILQETTQKLSALGSSLSVKIETNELFVSIAGSVGKPCISSIKACIHDGFVYFPRLKINPKFLYRIFESGTCYAGLGKWGTQLNLNTDTIGAIRIAMPLQEEIDQLLTFLDRETAKIDALVAEQQRLIELLKEKRQAVISHAVTTGLNPDVPMKDSGVEWLGEIPEHWQVTPMRMIANIVRGASPRPAGDPKYFGGDAVSWVTVAEITKDDAVYLTETENFLTLEGAAHSNLFRNGTLIYSNSGATLGVPKILCIDACANDGVVAFLNLDSKVHAEFLYYYLSSITDYIRERIKQGSGQPNLNTDIVKDLRFGLPPLNEQQSITQYIQEIAEQFSLLTATAERSITLLQERRTALISAAVTGKIKVTGITE